MTNLSVIFYKFFGISKKKKFFRYQYRSIKYQRGLFTAVFVFLFIVNHDACELTDPRFSPRSIIFILLYVKAGKVLTCVPAEASPGVRVLMADLRGHGWTVAGVKSVAAHRVHRVPHHGSDGRARREPPVGRIWQSKQHCC